jgi:hypothetical protein
MTSGKKKRGKFPANEFGFSIDPKLAIEFRDIRWKIACLPLARKKPAPDAFAKPIYVACSAPRVASPAL